MNEVKKKLPLVVLIDDDALFRKAVELNLRGRFEVMGFSNPQEVSRQQLDQADVLLVDINLTEVSGLDFAEKIRKDFQNKPIVLVTGFADKQKLLRAVRIGVTDFLEKPCDEVLLETTLTRVIGHAELLRNLERAKIELERIAAINAMVATYNHELRSPLAIAMGCLNSSKEDPAYREKVKTALDRMIQVVSEIEQVTSHLLPLAPHEESGKMVKIGK